MLYKDFAPTQFDTRGLGLEDRQDWLVVPCTQTRDSDVLSQSNFEVAQRILDEDKVEYEIHSFNHWGPGWFDIIIVHPSGEKSVDSIECALADYPVLDDTDYSEREYEYAYECWESYGFAIFVRNLRKTFGLSANAEEILLQGNKDKAWEYHMDNSNEPYYNNDSDLSFGFDYVSGISRTSVANTIRGIRRNS